MKVTKRQPLLAVLISIGMLIFSGCLGWIHIPVHSREQFERVQRELLDRCRSGRFERFMALGIPEQFEAIDIMEDYVHPPPSSNFIRAISLQGEPAVQVAIERLKDSRLESRMSPYAMVSFGNYIRNCNKPSSTFQQFEALLNNLISKIEVKETRDSLLEDFNEPHSDCPNITQLKIQFSPLQLDVCAGRKP